MDSEGEFSDQIDVVIFDRQYSPTMFEFEGATVVPAEAVYALFEAWERSGRGADSTTFPADERVAGSFLLELMARLQGCGTAPAIDYRAYAKWMGERQRVGSRE